MPRRELVVVGAGVLGAAAAWHATRAGLEDVLVLDRGAPCSGTSPLGAGLVSRLLFTPEEIAFVDRSLTDFHHLDRLAGDAFTFHETGSLLVSGPATNARTQRMARVWRAHDVNVREVASNRLDDVPGLAGLELSPGERAYLAAGDGWAVTTDAVRAMLDQVQAAGGQIQLDTPVARVDDEGVHLEGGDRVRADATVVAAGVWTPRLLDHGWRPPIQAYRAQAAALKHGRGATPGPCVHDLANHTYWRPEGPDKLVIGDGTDLAPHDVDAAPQADSRFASGMLEKLQARWPAAEGTSLVRAWAGYAAGTPDARPLLGPVPGLETVYLCTGGNGFGFMRGPALGEAATRTVLGRSPPVPLTGCRPDRFEDPPERFELTEGFGVDPGDP